MVDPKRGLGVALGLSGGIDSAVAAYLLRQKGYDVVGVTLQLYRETGEPGPGDGTRDDVDRARAVAAQLGIHHVVVDATELFQTQVVEYFVAEYAAGRTPNPCCKCNSRVKLVVLGEVADAMDLDCIATGHYARLVGDPPGLARGVDPCKDQSYVLAEVAPDLLRRTMFPLGAITKERVRELAAQGGLVAGQKGESQEICFIVDDDYRGFLSRRLGPVPGRIVDESGSDLGGHAGTYNYTIGQRRRLGIAAGEPLYVVAVDAGRRQVTVGPAGTGAVGVLRVADVVMHRELAPASGRVQVRSTGEAVPARLAGGGTILLEQPAVGVAPGQSAVFYRGTEVVLAGTITSTEPWSSRGDSPAEGPG